MKQKQVVRTNVTMNRRFNSSRFSLSTMRFTSSLAHLRIEELGPQPGS